MKPPTIRDRVRQGRRVYGLRLKGLSTAQAARELGITPKRAETALWSFNRNKARFGTQSPVVFDGPVAFYLFERFGSNDPKRIDFNTNS